MCGRFTLIATPQTIRAAFDYPEQPNFPPRYNIAPTQPIAIVRMGQGPSQGRRQFALVRWGLIAPWVKDPRGQAPLFNARGETVSEKPAFRNAMRRRRCLIPADGFYEWQNVDGRKQPFYMRAQNGAHDGAPFAFAGLWETWSGPNGEEIESAAIVTTASNAALSALHARMPVVIPPHGYEEWLDCMSVDEKAARAWIVAAPEDFFVIQPVSAAVNRVANDAPALVEPLTVDEEAALRADRPAAKPARKPRAALKEQEDDGQASLF